MSSFVEVAVIATKTVILGLGGLITYFAYKAYRKTDSGSLRALAIGFGVITVGALLAGIAHQALGVSITAGVLINSLLTAIGLGVITYSLYAE